MSEETALIIAEETWKQQGDIRDVISLSKLVKKHDGPGEIAEIIKKLLRRSQSMEIHCSGLVIVVVVMVFLLNSMYVIRASFTLLERSDSDIKNFGTIRLTEALDDVFNLLVEGQNSIQKLPQASIMLVMFRKIFVIVGALIA